MSLRDAAVPHASADVRAELVALLDGLGSLTGYPVAPDQATAGAAWPKWVQSLPNGHLCDTWATTWEVYAVLPADYLATTVDQGDKLRDELAPVLARYGSVTYAEPVQIQFNDRQTMPGIRVRMVTS
jgi:hypothetical protein